MLRFDARDKRERKRRKVRFALLVHDDVSLIDVVAMANLLFWRSE